MGITVVTGASGHLGLNLVRALLARGRSVRALVHADQRGLEEMDVELARGDVSDVASLAEAFQGADVVYHCAGYVSVRPRDWTHLSRINVHGVANVVQAGLIAGVRRLVHVSSIEALADYPLNAPVDESRPLVGAGATGYARSKALGEQHVWRAVEKGMDAIVLNPTGLFGPYDYRLTHTNAGMLLMCCARLPVLIDGGFDWVDVRDVAEGAIRAETLGRTGSRYILGGRSATMRELRLLARDVTGAGMPRLTCPMLLARCAAPFADGWTSLSRGRVLFTSAALRPLRGNPAITHMRAERELGYRPRPLRETVVDTLKWFEEHPVR